MKVNRVCHYQAGNSNKVYIASISEVNGKYIVVGKWGGVGKKVSTQTKGTCDSYRQAEVHRDKLLATKIKKGYVDIESRGYSGQLHMNHVWLRQYLEDEPTTTTATATTGELSKEAREEAKELIRQGKKINAIRRIREDTHCDLREAKDIAEVIEIEVRAEKVEPKVESKVSKPKEMKVVCVDSVGLEHCFDEGMTYAAMNHPEGDMIYVVDRNGEKQECFQERFKKASEPKFKEFQAGDSIEIMGEPLAFRKHFG